MTHKIGIFNATTGEEIIREMNDNELAQWETEKAENEAKTQAVIEAQAKRQEALAKLEALGLNEDDLRALGFQA